MDEGLWMKDEGLFVLDEGPFHPSSFHLSSQITLLPIKLSPFFLHLPLNDDGSSNALPHACAHARGSSNALLLVALLRGCAYARDSSSVRLRFFC